MKVMFPNEVLIYTNNSLSFVLTYKTVSSYLVCNTVEYNLSLLI